MIFYLFKLFRQEELEVQKQQGKSQEVGQIVIVLVVEDIHPEEAGGGSFGGGGGRTEVSVKNNFL